MEHGKFISFWVVETSNLAFAASPQTNDIQGTSHFLRCLEIAPSKRNCPVKDIYSTSYYVTDESCQI